MAAQGPGLVVGCDTSWNKCWIVTEALAGGLITPTGSYFVRVVAEPGIP
jgi:hypothetical protein